MNLEEIKQQAIESTEKKISRGREMIADTKLDIETKKKEIKERNEPDMGKGMRPKMGYNDKKYKTNYDNIDWSSTRKNRQGLMNSATKVHEDKRQKDTDKRHQKEIDER